MRGQFVFGQRELLKYNACTGSSLCCINPMYVGSCLYIAACYSSVTAVFILTFADNRT